MFLKCDGLLIIGALYKNLHENIALKVKDVRHSDVRGGELS